MNWIDFCLVVACILCVIAGVMRVGVKAWDSALMSFALGFFALAFLVTA